MLHPSGTCRVWADVARRALFNGITEIDELAIKPVHRLIPLSFPDRCGVVLRSASTLRTGCDINILPTDSAFGFDRWMAAVDRFVSHRPWRDPLSDAGRRLTSRCQKPSDHSPTSGQKRPSHVLPDFDSGNEF